MDFKETLLADLLVTAFAEAGKVMLLHLRDENPELAKEEIWQLLKDDFPVAEPWLMGRDVKKQMTMIACSALFSAALQDDSVALVEEGLTNMRSEGQTTRIDGATFVLNMLSTIYEEQKASPEARML